jgi:hypothetical protein
MTQEDKKLLLNDLCARLPHGVKLGFYASATKQTYICTLLGLEPQEDEPVIAKTENGSFYMLAGHVKPYLFPLSSMTDEQKKEFDQLIELELKAINNEIDHIQATTFEVDFYNKHHFDYRGLIEKDLAIDATGLNIY